MMSSLVVHPPLCDDDPHRVNIIHRNGNAAASAMMANHRSQSPSIALQRLHDADCIFLP